MSSFAAPLIVPGEVIAVLKEFADWVDPTAELIVLRGGVDTELPGINYRPIAI